MEWTGGMDWWTGMVESQIQQKRGQMVTVLIQKNIIRLVSLNKVWPVLIVH